MKKSIILMVLISLVILIAIQSAIITANNETTNETDVNDTDYNETDDGNETDYNETDTDTDDPDEYGYQFKYKHNFKEKNKLKFTNKTGAECPEGCNCQGSVLTCPLENSGAQMTVYAGKSGNIIMHTKGVNVSTNVSIYNENGTLWGQFKGNKTREIKVLPDQVMEKIRERIRARLEKHNITLDENGTYQIQAQKRARLFFMFPVEEGVDFDMNSETGEIINANGPWWGFLARDVKKED